MVYASIKVFIVGRKVKVTGAIELLKQICEVGAVHYTQNVDIRPSSASFTMHETETFCSASLHTKMLHFITDIDIVPLLNILQANGYSHVTTISADTGNNAHYTMFFASDVKPTLN